MQLERLKMFATLAECRSFSRTAEMSFISQSAVSQQIASLEKELGCRLLERDRKGNVSLTPAGQVFYEGCLDTLREYENTLTRLRNLTDGKRSLNIGMASGSSVEWLGQITDLLSAVAPDIRLSPVFEEFNGLRYALESGRCDAVVSIEFGLTDIPGVLYEELIELEPVLLVSRRHRLADRESVRPEELAGERFVTISEKNARHSYEHWLRARREDGIPVTDLLKVETSQAQAAMVEMNEAVAVLPLLRDLTSFNSFKCVPIRIEGIRERVRYVIAYRESLKGDPNLQKFIEVTKLVYGRERTIIR